MKVPVLCSIIIGVTLGRAQDDGTYHPDNEGKYIPDFSGRYNPDNSGEYRHDGTGGYVGDDHGRYQNYREGYKNQKQFNFKGNLASATTLKSNSSDQTSMLYQYQILRNITTGNGELFDWQVMWTPVVFIGSMKLRTKSPAKKMPESITEALKRKSSEHRVFTNIQDQTILFTT
ncbi:hypothetical protein JTB14_014976 [Gonioctena quinquepunctata]|nr:hypothetical protein JTB14_014976 [Gonioctena quinquepunctata]